MDSAKAVLTQSIEINVCLSDISNVFCPLKDICCPNTRMLQSPMSKYCHRSYSPTLKPVSIITTLSARISKYHLLVFNLVLNCGILGRFDMSLE